MLGLWCMAKVKAGRKHGAVRFAVLSLVRATKADSSDDDLLLDNLKLRQLSVGLQICS